MTYAQLFRSVLMEQDLPAPDRPSHAQTPNADAFIMDEPETSDQLSTDRNPSEQAAIEIFNKKFNLLHGIENIPPAEMNEKLDELETYISTLTPFLKQKTVDMRNPYSIMANALNADAVKLARFEQINSAIEEYKDTAKKQEEVTELAAKSLKEKVAELSKVKNAITPSEEPSLPSAPLPASVSPGL